MSLAHSPSIARNGLVFYYDMLNTAKSWKGAPVTNLYGSIDNSNIRTPNTVHFWDGNAWSTSGSYTHPGIAGPIGTYLGKVYKFTSGALSSTWSGNSYGYMLKTMSTSNGQYNAMSCWAYVSDNCNIDAIPASIENATSTAAISGVASSYNMSSKGTWQRIGLSCTASASSMNFIPMYPQRYGVTDGSFTGFFMFAMPQVETNTYPSVGIETSRSNTQAVLEITNNNSITATSLTYNSDNTFNFDGSSNYVSVPNSSSLQVADTFTVDSWIYPTNLTGRFGIFSTRTINTTGSWQLEVGTGNGGTRRVAVTGIGTWIWESADSVIPINSWSHVCFVKTSNAVQGGSLYLNGALLTPSTTTAYTISNNTDTKVIGQGTNGAQFFSGKINSLKLYNRALTATEVLQNFNAQRDRYGI